MIDKVYFKVKIVEHLRVKPWKKSALIQKVLQGFYPGAITPNYIVMSKYASAAMDELINTGVINYTPRKPLTISTENK